MQVWQTPVRHDHLTVTSHASANSSKLANLESHATVRPLRANEIERPDPGGPCGRCGVWPTFTMPGVVHSRAPKTSICTFPSGTPQFRSPSRMLSRNDDGPHR